MTKQDILKAIENGESVWVVDKDLKRVIPYNANSIIVNNFNADALGYNFEDLYKTKSEAEHYLHHANITRIEHLPFLTWEEFLKKKELNFYDKNHKEYSLNIEGEYIWLYGGDYAQEWKATEENFYKAYDKCVRLFKQE